MIVNYIKMNPISAGSGNVPHLLAQASKIGGKNGWCYAAGSHGRSLQETVNKLNIEPQYIDLA